MKIKYKKELKQKTIEELSILLKEFRGELSSLKLEKIQKKLKNITSIFTKQKDIARILTIIKEKELSK